MKKYLFVLTILISLSVPQLYCGNTQNNSKKNNANNTNSTNHDQNIIAVGICSILGYAIYHFYGDTITEYIWGKNDNSQPKANTNFEPSLQDALENPTPPVLSSNEPSLEESLNNSLPKTHLDLQKTENIPNRSTAQVTAKSDLWEAIKKNASKRFPDLDPNK